MSLGELVGKFEGLIADSMMREHVVGLSLAVVKDGEVVYAKGFGARNLKASLPATPDTLYGIGSCTKSFTALAVMQLSEQGKLDLNDPVEKHVPEFKISKNGSQIAIHHLLSHSSGIPDLGAADIEINRFVDVDADEKWVPFTSFDDVMTFLNGAASEVAAAPGTRFFYLNEGYSILGRIVEKASGMRYEDYVAEKILKPLKMTRSGFPSESLERDPDFATCYVLQKKGDSLTPTPSGLPLDRLGYPAGGMVSSVMELSHYLTTCLNDGAFEGVRILGQPFKEMYKRRIDVGYPSVFGRRWYGYGWSVYEDFFGHELIGHSGSTLVSGADLRFVPDLNMGVAVASNNGSANTVYLAGPALLTALMGKDPLKEIPVFEIERKMSMLAGNYETYKGIAKVTVSKKGGILFLESKDKLSEQSLALIPESDRLDSLKFHILTGGTRLPAEFVIDANGKIDLYLERNRFHKVN